VFTLNPSHPQKGEEPAFQMEFSSLQPKGFSSHPYLKEIEEKALKRIKEKSLLIEKEAYEKGFAQGERDGVQLGQKRLEALIQQWKDLLMEMQSQRIDLYQVYERDLVALAFSISKRVLHHELTLHRDVIAFALREAFQHVVDQKKMTVHLNPMDHKYLLTHPEGCPPALKGLEGVNVIEDPTISRGGCFLETSFGDVDATIESQLDRIAAVVWERMEQSEPLFEPPTE
jgi:flagellar assembly protein FliH